MKLLNLQKTQEAKGQEDALSILRTKELRGLEQKARVDLAKAEADFNDTLARNRKKWADEEESYVERRKKMEREIEELEERRALLLVPIKVFEDAVKRKNEEADARLEEVSRKELEVVKSCELLENKLDWVGEKEQDLIAREKRISSERTGLDMSINALHLERETFNRVLADFHAESQRKAMELADRETKIVLRERSVEAKERGIESEEREIEREKIRLKDQRETLERTLQRGG